MAEVFEKPKLFTKKWWGYFWEYYKWYVIVIVCAVIATVITVDQIRNQPNYLFNITYAGGEFFSDEVKTPLLEALSKNQSAEENDGILFTQLNFDYSEKADIQYESAMLYKMQIEFTTDETMLFLFDEKKLQDVTSAESTSEIWVPVSEWAEEMPSEDLIKCKYGVCLKNSKLLNEIGINGENLYIAVRNNYSKDNEDAEKRHEYGVVAANRLIEE